MEIDVQNNSGMGKEAELPQEVKHFNWSAFFITWIWGVFNASYLTLISLAFGVTTWILGIVLWFVAVLGMASDNMNGMILYCIYSVLVFLGGIALRVWFGVKGNQWAWQNKKWNSTEHFNRVQKQWVLGTIIAAVALGFVIFAYIGIVAAMTMPTLLSNTEKAQTKAMMKKAVATVSQAAVMNEALDTKCGRKSSAEGIANCFGERLNGQVVGNKIELNDGIDLIFHSGSKCVNDGTCYVIIDTTTRSRGKDKATIRLYSDKDGYIKVNEEDSQKIIDKYSSNK